MALSVHEMRGGRTPAFKQSPQTHRVFPYRAAMALVEAVFAYEWLVSASDKLLSAMFFLHLQRELEHAANGLQYRFYAEFLQAIDPRSHLLAILVVSGELFVGIGFFVLIIGTLWRRNAPSPAFLWLGAIVTLTGTFMNINFFFFQNGAYFVNPGDPFNEGVPIDFCMAAIQFGLFVLYTMTLCNGPNVRPESQ